MMQHLIAAGISRDDRAFSGRRFCTVATPVSVGYPTPTVTAVEGVTAVDGVFCA